MENEKRERELRGKLSIMTENVENAIEEECSGDKNDRVYKKKGKLNDRVCKKKGKLKAKRQHLT